MEIVALKSLFYVFNSNFIFIQGEIVVKLMELRASCEEWKFYGLEAIKLFNGGNLETIQIQQK